MERRAGIIAGWVALVLVGTGAACSDRTIDPAPARAIAGDGGGTEDVAAPPEPSGREYTGMCTTSDFAFLDTGCTFPAPKNASALDCWGDCPLMIHAMQWDEEHECVHPDVKLGCVAPPPGVAYGGAPESRICRRNVEDGRIVLVAHYDSFAVSGPAWTKCTAMDAVKLGIDLPPSRRAL